MSIRQSNPFAAITVIVLVAITLMGFWIALPIYGELSNFFHDDSDLVIYTTESDCVSKGHYWITDEVPNYCSFLPTMARDSISLQRKAWLFSPFIFILSLIIWYITKSTHKDTQQWQQ